MTDPISDMIIRLKNAARVSKHSLVLPYSKMKAAVSEALQEEGYIAGYEKKGKKANKVLEITLLYDKNNASRIKGVERISKPSKRVYKKSSEIKPVRQGYGAAVLSTPKGVIVGSKAKEERVGGEVLFTIW